jgi:hypothetical protein
MSGQGSLILIVSCRCSVWAFLFLLCAWSVSQAALMWSWDMVERGVGWMGARDGLLMGWKDGWMELE